MQSKPYHHGDLKNALIEAGMRILVERGVSGLSLRRVAELAGVSHSAPYAHFKDKQELLAAIATAGFDLLLQEFQVAADEHPGKPAQQIVQAAGAYMEFALKHTELFRLMFSRMLSNINNHPELEEVTTRLFRLVVEVTSSCGDHPAQDQHSNELRAVIIWGQVHGIVQLALDNQISGNLLQAYSPQEIISRAVLSQLK